MMNKNCTKENREKSRLRQMGSNNSFFGKHHTEETRLRISKTTKGRKQTKEHAMKKGLSLRKTHRQRLSNYSIYGECWLWQGAKDIGGYGTVGDGRGKIVKAHRLSYKEFVGEIQKGICVLHKCDTPACINPAHLFLGTQKDNMKDMYSKGRRKNKGDNAPKRTLSEAIVVTIRKEYTGGWGQQTKMAKKYNTSQANISSIVRNKTWVI